MSEKDSNTTVTPSGAGEPGSNRDNEPWTRSQRAALKAAAQRRNLLKALSIAGIPAVWARPVVEAVVLPAHAQTSEPVVSEPVGCGAPADCYSFASGGGFDLSFSWSGGTGPETVQSFFGTDCSGDESGDLGLVVAANEAEAEELSGFSGAVELITDPAPSGGCSFFVFED